MIPVLNLDWLRKNHKMIHYFGLGFIQLKVDETWRFHFYHPELPRITNDEEVHNHRYNFHSSILMGTFKHETFEVTRGRGWIKERETCRPDAPCENPFTEHCGLSLNTTFHLRAGDSYYLAHNVFHRVVGHYAITRLKRGPIEKEFAEVIRKEGESKICPFSSKIPEARLWAYVEHMIGKDDPTLQDLPR